LLPNLNLPFGLGWPHVGCCCGAVIILILVVVIIMILRRRKPQFEPYGEFSAGSDSMDTGLLGYKHPCRYCGKLINQGAKLCQFCAKVSPLGPLRCPKCRNPIEKGQKVCSNCGLTLEISCPWCNERTFFADYCKKCDKRLMIICGKCLKEQPPMGEKCIKCGKKLEDSGVKK